jgi:hypothetical protein
MRAAAAQPQRSDIKSRGAILAQLQTPLKFFGLLLITVEGSFGVCLARYSYSEQITKLFANWMGVLFLVSALAVVVLTKIAPNDLLLRSEDQTVMNPYLQAERIREAVKIMLKYSESKQKTPERLIDTLDRVEKLLKDPIKAEEQLKDS